MDKRTAVLEAIRNCERWMGGAVVVKDDDGYYAIPGAYLTDISYTGARDELYRATNLTDIGGPEATMDDLDALADFVTDNTED